LLFHRQNYSIKQGLLRLEQKICHYFFLEFSDAYETGTSEPEHFVFAYGQSRDCINFTNGVLVNGILFADLDSKGIVK